MCGWQVKLCDPLVTHALRWWYTTLKALYKYQTLQNTRLLGSFKASCRQRISSCVRDLQEWCASRRLQLYAFKTELIWFGSRSSLSRLKPEDRTLEIGATVVKPTDVVRDLGVLLDIHEATATRQQDGQHLLLPPTPASAILTSPGHRYHEAAGVRFHLQLTRLL